MVDPIVKRTINSAVGLRAAAEGDPPDALAIYRNRAGEDVFVLQREGVVLLQVKRLIRNDDMEAVKIDPEVKNSIVARKIILTLSNGEQVEVPVDGEDGQYLDVFPIHAFIRRRVVQQRKPTPRP